jgi:hypothetical protein
LNIQFVLKSTLYLLSPGKESIEIYMERVLYISAVVHLWAPVGALISLDKEGGRGKRDKL